jgi:hypothetical protein
VGASTAAYTSGTATSSARITLTSDNLFDNFLLRLDIPFLLLQRIVLSAQISLGAGPIPAARCERLGSADGKGKFLSGLEGRKCENYWELC